MADKRIPNVTLEGVEIKFRNFAGNEDQYTRPGQRHFTVTLPEPVALDMLNDGWNVKKLNGRPEIDGEEDTYIINVAVNFDGPRPPQVTMITGTERTNLMGPMVDILDWAEITNVDLIINPSIWSMGGKTGVKAYLEKMFITVEEDELDKKYNHN